MRKIGTFFPDAEHYADEANSTIGQPLLSQQVLDNRRNASSKLTPVGQHLLRKVEEYFSRTFGVAVMLKWSKNAGCSSCPCSPGFNIHTSEEELQPFYRPLKRIRDSNKFDIFVKGMALDVRLPKREIPFIEKHEVAMLGLS